MHDLFEKVKQLDETDQDREHEVEDSDDDSEDDFTQGKPLKCCTNIWTKYEKRTLFLICVAFFNEGAEFMTLLACTFKLTTNEHLEPAAVTLYIAEIASPVILAAFFGLLSDTLDIAGFRKRIYIFVAALL
jgi:hypothetical protein